MNRSVSHNVVREGANVLFARRYAFCFWLLTSASIFLTSHVFAGGNYQIGASFGYGGSGIMQAVKVNGTATVVQRSEGPGMISIFADRFLTNYLSVGVEHSRGFSLAPFSMGSSFTGLAGRWYFWGPAANVAADSEGQTILLVKRFTPFAGFAAGVAAAEIKRENDAVPSVSGSGAYTGIRIGADYPLAPGVGIRPEISTSTTFYQNPALPSTLSEFAVQCGLYWVF